MATDTAIRRRVRPSIPIQKMEIDVAGIKHRSPNKKGTKCLGADTLAIKNKIIRKHEVKKAFRRKNFHGVDAPTTNPMKWISHDP
jgi:hypothetical protein